MQHYTRYILKQMIFGILGAVLSGAIAYILIASRILNWLQPADNTPAEIRRAKQLITALESGGIPLDPAIIVRIAGDLGLEVSKKARMEDTIERIRMAIERY